MDLFAISGNWISGANQWIETLLQSNGSLGLALPLLFLGGFLASLLPCVYPLYPITAGILSSRGQGSVSKVLHPSVYYLGLATAYFFFGILAALSGGGFNQLLRIPLVNIGIAVVIFILGLSTIELLVLPFFGGREVPIKPGIGGSFLLGVGAGFLSSPCVGPVVVAILLQILATMQDGIVWSQVGLAGLKMFAFGLGVGFPFFLIGVFGAKLPRSGKWMKPVQYVLGVLVFYFSYSFYLKGMIRLGFSEEQSFVLILVVLSILFGFYKLLFRGLHHQERMKRSLLWSLGLFFLVVFAKLLVFPSPSFTNDLPPETHGNLTWYRSTDQALQLAQQIQNNLSEHKGKVPLVFVDFYADWCTNCKSFAKLTLSKTELNQALASAVLLKITDEDPEFTHYQNDKRFPELLIGLPFFVILDAKGDLIWKSTDYLQTQAMIDSLKQ